MNLRRYIQEFNRNDTEYTVTDIDNVHCAEWLENEIPLFECSGSPHKKPIAGLRPTLNSYMYADAAAIYDFSRLNKAPMEEYLEKLRKFVWLCKKYFGVTDFLKPYIRRTEASGERRKWIIQKFRVSS